jgi:hypothetical protein
MGTVASYPYLGLVLGLTLLSAAALALARGPERRAMLISGLLAAPWGITAFAYTPSYWQPARLLPLPLSVEDLLGSFSIGVLAWALTRWPRGNRTEPRIHALDFAKRLLVGWGLGSVLVLLLIGAGCTAMSACLAAMVVVDAAVLLCRPALRGVWLRGTFSFALLYSLSLKLMFVLVPSFILQWNDEALVGLRLYGVPVEEIVWAAAFGGGWPTVLAYAMEPMRISLRMRTRPEPSGLSLEETAERTPAATGD